MNINIVEQTSGKSRHYEDYNLLYEVYRELECYPVATHFDKSVYSVQMLNLFKERLPQYELITIFEKRYMSFDDDNVYSDYIAYKIAPGYYIELNSGETNPDNYDEDYEFDEDNAFISSNINLLTPPTYHSTYSKELEDIIIEIIKSSKLEYAKSKPSIGMICQEDGSFFMKDFIIGDYELIEPDLHYGKGFYDFHVKVLNKLQNGKKGLFLFHGEPGTGKTYYIRCLLSKLVDGDKFIIYIPPGMVSYITSPEMITYLSEMIALRRLDNKRCIILLEDADPLLISRNGGNDRSEGITNLLNMTDGLLNDMLDIQVIATFNTNLTNLDTALLRPERLTARKEFKRLTREDSNKLIKHLKINKVINEPKTLAEIYCETNDQEVLLHEYDNIKKTIGFGK